MVFPYLLESFCIHSLDAYERCRRNYGHKFPYINIRKNLSTVSTAKPDFQPIINYQSQKISSLGQIAQHLEKCQCQTRIITVCNKCSQKPLKLTLTPDCGCGLTLGKESQILKPFYQHYHSMKSDEIHFGCLQSVWRQNLTSDP